MNRSDSATPYQNMKSKYQYCDSCGSLLPAPGFFCVKCDPPVHPELNPEKGLHFTQVCLRITLLTLAFLAVAIFKLDIKLISLLPDKSTHEMPLKIAEDEDYKMFYKVKVRFANLRDEPNSKTSTILFVLKKDTQVEILDKKDKWSKIRSKPQAGNKARTGWLANSLLESEIK
jgi:hypothetical protein